MLEKGGVSGDEAGEMLVVMERRGVRDDREEKNVSDDGE